MVVIMSCDHHDESGSLPDNRSRVRMLEQLRAAQVLSDTVVRGMGEARLREGVPTEVALSLATWNELVRVWLAWNEVAPRGDDWAAAFVPPSEIRVPPDVEDAPVEDAQGGPVAPES